MNSEDNTETASRLQWLQRWLIDPLQEMSEPDQQRARFMAAISLSLVLLGWPLVLLFHFTESPPDGVFFSARNTVSIILTAIMLLYPLTRTRYYLVAAWGAVLTFTLPYYLLIVPTISDVGAEILYYLVIPLIICSILFSVRTVMLVAGINLVLIVSTPLVFPDHLRVEEVVLGPLSMVGAAALLLIFSSQLAQGVRKSEQEQQAMAEALSDIAIALNSSLELDDVLERMLTHLSRVLPHDAATIMVVEDGVARVIRHVGFLPRGIPEHTLLEVRFPIDEIANLRYMVETGQPVLMPDVRKDPNWVVVEKATDWIYSYLGAPVMFEGEMLGVINVDSATPGTFNEDHARRLVSFAAQAAVALRNARLKTELDELVALRSAQLEREQRLLQAVLDASGEGVVYTEGMTIQYANRTLHDMTGYELGELKGQNSLMFVEADLVNPVNMDHWMRLLEAVQRGEVLREDVKFYRKDGSTFDAGLTVSAVQYSSDNTWGTVTIVRDISQEKALDEKKARFIANAAHELRSPIASLNTRLYMIQRDPGNLERHVDLLARVIERMNRLVEDLLDLSRFENGVIQLRPRSVILQNVVNDVVELQRAEAEQKSIHLECTLPLEPVQVYMDPERITQVLTNLVRNAIIYTQEGGRVEVRAEPEDSTRGTLTGVRVWVCDDGPGITAEVLPHIFQPFYRAEDRSHGTGLGLSIAREIIQMHNGSLTASSEPGHGSAFCFHLPLGPQES